MVAMMLYGPWQGPMQPIWTRQLQQYGVDAADHTQVVRFLGQPAPGLKGAHNQLFTMFCWLRRIYQEMEDQPVTQMDHAMPVDGL